MHDVPVAKGIICGMLFSCSAGIVYIILLHEPGSLFYPFAILFFIIGPLIAGTIGAARSPKDKYQAFLISGGAVFTAALLLFFITYAVLPHFDRTSVQLPNPATAFPAALIRLLSSPTSSREQELAYCSPVMNRPLLLR